MRAALSKLFDPHFFSSFNRLDAPLGAAPLLHYALTAGLRPAKRVLMFLGRSRALLFGAFVAGVLAAPPVNAQTIVDARRIEFTPSADHNTVDANGAPAVQRYSLDVFVAGGPSVVASADLGKPTPGGDGMIRLDFVALLSSPLVTGVTYEAAVQAVGPGGTSASVRSNPFSFSGPCTLSISPSSASFAAGGGTGSSTVTAGSGCAWTAVSQASWITVTSGAARTGSGSVGFSVAANTATTSRSGTLTIAGVTFSVTQAAASCTFSTSPTSASFAAAGGTGTSTVTTGGGCAWTAVSQASWITVTSGAARTGSGSVGFSVAANTATTSRSGTLTIAGATFSVTQAAAAGTGCASSISPTSRSFAADGGTGSSTVTAASGCAWDAVSNAAWIAVFTGAPGTGNGTVTFVVATNSTGTARTGTLIIAGKTFTVTQSGPCSYSVAPTALSVGAAAVTGAFTMTTQPGCAWSPSATPSWITLSGPGTGSGTLTYAIAPNLGKAIRTGSFTVGGKTVTVTQAGRLGPPANVRVLK